MTDNEEYDSWKSVLTKPRTNKSKTMNIIFRGSKQTQLDSKIRGAVRREWLYVVRIHGRYVSSGDIKEYLVVMNIGDRLVVKKLNTKGVNSSFGVEVPDVQDDQIINGDY